MQRLLRLTVLSIGLLFSCVGLYAQERTISGKVTAADASPLVGVTVNIKGTNKATLTDEQGKFTISARKGQTLHFSYVGYAARDVQVGEDNSITIQMTTSAHNVMEDVVVVGYGTQKRGNLTGAVSTVNVEKTLGSRPITDAARGLQGAVPGLTITTPSGDIGTNPSIRLRGMVGSLNGPGAVPLILVDNVELPDLRMIDPQDIESISVLKDAASASIYGTRGAWGVILITTKSGKKGAERNRISYSNNFSWSQPTNTPKIASAVEGAEMAFKALQRTNPNVTQFGVVGMYIDQTAIEKMKEWQEQYGGQDLGNEMVMGRDFEIRNNKLFFYRSWDPREMFMRDWTPMQKHNLTLSGSNGKTAYDLGFGYLNQTGVLKVNPDQFERYNINLGVNSSVTKWLDARAKVILSKGTKTRPFYFSSETYDPWYYLLRWPAVYPYGTYEGKPFRSAVTEVQQAHMTPIETTLGRVQVGGTFKITKGLTIDADYTYGATNEHEHQTGGSVSAYNFWAGGGNLNYSKYTSSSYNRARYISEWDQRSVFKSFATYNKRLSDHDFKIIVGTDVEQYAGWYQTSERRELLMPDMGEPRLAIGDQYASNGRGHWATLGYFGRLNYAFKDKYLFEANGRYDGSSSFPLNDQWAFFPSFSAGYIISKEDFMDFAKPVLSTLKLRGSWGSIGNQALRDKLFLSVLDGNEFLSEMRTSSSGWIIGSDNMLTVTTPPLVSPTLSWERVSTLDFGADARFFNSAFGVTFDWYKRTTSDMITGGITVPSTLGTGAPVINYGELQTTGWELALDWNHRFDNGLSFNVTGVLSDFKEVVTAYAANSTKLFGKNFEGRVIGDIWGYETDRFFNNNDFEQDANGNLLTDANGKYIMKSGVPTQTKWESGWFFYGPGDVKYKDLNGDGVIDYGANTLDDHGDLKVIGNSTPRYQYGLRLGADWKGFDLSVYIQGVGKRELWANGPVVIPGYRPGEAWFQHQLNYWTPENPNAFYPRPTDAGQSNNNRNFLPQTKYLLNMAYTRLKNLSIGYTLPGNISSKLKLEKARIYLSGENLLTKDHLNGIPVDPEVDYTEAGLNDSNTFGRVYPYRKTLSVGVQITL